MRSWPRPRACRSTWPRRWRRRTPSAWPSRAACWPCCGVGSPRSTRSVARSWRPRRSSDDPSTSRRCAPPPAEARRRRSTGWRRSLRRGLIREVQAAGDGDVRYDFTHGRLRDVAYEDTSLARRRLLHGRVADALVTLGIRAAGCHALGAHRLACDARGSDGGSGRGSSASRPARARRLCQPGGARAPRGGPCARSSGGRRPSTRRWATF